MNQRSCSKGGVKTPSVHHPNQDLKNVQTITTQPYTTWKHNHSSQHQYARLGTTLTLNMAVMLQSRSLVPTQPMPHSPTRTVVYLTCTGTIHAHTNEHPCNELCHSECDTISFSTCANFSPLFVTTRVLIEHKFMRQHHNLILLTIMQHYKFNCQFQKDRESVARYLSELQALSEFSMV